MREQILPPKNTWHIHYFKLVIFYETADKGKALENQVGVTLL